MTDHQLIFVQSWWVGILLVMLQQEEEHISTFRCHCPESYSSAQEPANAVLFFSVSLLMNYSICNRFLCPTLTCKVTNLFQGLTICCLLECLCKQCELVKTHIPSLAAEGTKRGKPNLESIKFSFNWDYWINFCRGRAWSISDYIFPPQHCNSGLLSLNSIAHHFCLLPLQ